MTRFKIVNLANLSRASNFETNSSRGLYLIIFLWKAYVHITHTSFARPRGRRETQRFVSWTVQTASASVVPQRVGGAGRKIVTFSFCHNFRERRPNATIEVSFPCNMRPTNVFPYSDSGITHASTSYASAVFIWAIASNVCVLTLVYQS